MDEQTWQRVAARYSQPSNGVALHYIIDHYEKDPRSNKNFLKSLRAFESLFKNTCVGHAIEGTATKEKIPDFNITCLGRVRRRTLSGKEYERGPERKFVITADDKIFRKVNYDGDDVLIPVTRLVSDNKKQEFYPSEYWRAQSFWNMLADQVRFSEVAWKAPPEEKLSDLSIEEAQLKVEKEYEGDGNE